MQKKERERGKKRVYQHHYILFSSIALSHQDPVFQASGAGMQALDSCVRFGFLCMVPTQCSLQGQPC